MLSILLGANQLHSAFLYFILGTVCLFLSVCVSFYIPRTFIYKFYVGDDSAQDYHWAEDFPVDAKIRLPHLGNVKNWKNTFAKVYLI